MHWEEEPRKILKLLAETVGPKAGRGMGPKERAAAIPATDCYLQSTGLKEAF